MAGNNVLEKKAGSDGEVMYFSTRRLSPMEGGRVS